MSNVSAIILAAGAGTRMKSAWRTEAALCDTIKVVGASGRLRIDCRKRASVA